MTATAPPKSFKALARSRGLKGPRAVSRGLEGPRDSERWRDVFTAVSSFTVVRRGRRFAHLGGVGETVSVFCAVRPVPDIRLSRHEGRSERR
ncbi:unnamed protein product [Lampetra planeri]